MCCLADKQLCTVLDMSGYVSEYVQFSLAEGRHLFVLAGELFALAYLFCLHMHGFRRASVRKSF
jgi:hypothetical protein